MKNKKRIACVFGIVAIAVIASFCVRTLMSNGDNNSSNNSNNNMVNTVDNSSSVSDSSNPAENTGDNGNRNAAIDSKESQNDVPAQDNEIQQSTDNASLPADNSNAVATMSTTSVSYSADKNINDIMIYGVAVDSADIVDSAMATKFNTHPDTRRANMLSSTGNQIEAINIARSSFKMMNWDTMTHTDSITKQDDGLIYLTRTYNGQLTDGRQGKLTVDIIYEADTNKLVYALLTSFVATQQLPSGTIKTEDMLASGI
jgi:hypothetical protein